MNPDSAIGRSHGSGNLLEERARVVEVFAGGAWIETQPRSGCNGCEARQGCGNGLLARWRRAPRLALLTEEKLHVGDGIRVGLPAGRFLLGALIVYGWPLILAIVAGGMAERLFTPGHIGVPLAFFGGLALGVLVSRYQLHHRQRHYRPRLIAIETSSTDRAATFSGSR